MKKIENKFEKFLISLSGILLVIISVLGMKIKDEQFRKENRFKELTENLADISNSPSQEIIEKNRQKKISEIINAPSQKTVQEKTTTTETPPPPPPPKVVETKPADKQTKTS